MCERVKGWGLAGSQTHVPHVCILCFWRRTRVAKSQSWPVCEGVHYPSNRSCVCVCVFHWEGNQFCHASSYSFLFCSVWGRALSYKHHTLSPSMGLCALDHPSAGQSHGFLTPPPLKAWHASLVCGWRLGPRLLPLRFPFFLTCYSTEHQAPFLRSAPVQFIHGWRAFLRAATAALQWRSSGSGAERVTGHTAEGGAAALIGHWWIEW